jgi:hypothetical protein
MRFELGTLLAHVVESPAFAESGRADSRRDQGRPIRLGRGATVIRSRTPAWAGLQALVLGAQPRELGLHVPLRQDGAVEIGLRPDVKNGERLPSELPAAAA